MFERAMGRQSLVLVSFALDHQYRKRPFLPGYFWESLIYQNKRESGARVCVHSCHCRRKLTLRRNLSDLHKQIEETEISNHKHRRDLGLCASQLSHPPRATLC